MHCVLWGGDVFCVFCVCCVSFVLFVSWVCFCLLGVLWVLCFLLVGVWGCSLVVLCCGGGVAEGGLYPLPHPSWWLVFLLAVWFLLVGACWWSSRGSPGGLGGVLSPGPRLGACPPAYGGVGKTMHPWVSDEYLGHLVRMCVLWLLRSLCA